MINGVSNKILSSIFIVIVISSILTIFLLYSPPQSPSDDDDIIDDNNEPIGPTERITIGPIFIVSKSDFGTNIWAGDGSASKSNTICYNRNYGIDIYCYTYSGQSYGNQIYNNDIGWNLIANARDVYGGNM